MKLNCKPGDLAVIVSSKYSPEHIGKIVRCVSYEGGFGLPGWVIDPPIGEYWACADKNLRPLRNEPGCDETIVWCGVPDEVHA